MAQNVLVGQKWLYDAQFATKGRGCGVFACVCVRVSVYLSVWG